MDDIANTDGTTEGTEETGAFARQVAGALIGAATLATTIVGDRLGLYAALAESGPSTSADLAAATGTTERYIREWLAQQASAGFVDFDAGTSRFALPPAHAAVLADGSSPASMLGDIGMLAGIYRQTENLAAAFRSGRGIAWADQDPLVFDATEGSWGPKYRAGLAGWLAGLGPADAVLRDGGTIADIGCGHGLATILMGHHYPAAQLTGFDSHEPSIATARRRAAAAGVGHRVHFEVAESTGYPAAGFDLIAFFDTLHDLGDPVGAARHALAALSPEGTLLLVEPYSSGDLHANLVANPGAAFGYALSTFLCTPNSLAQPGAQALGAMAGETRLREVLTHAGYGTVRRIEATAFNLVMAAQR